MAISWIRIIINIIFICIQIAINQFAVEVHNTPDCAYNEDWKVQQIKTLSMIMIVVNMVNMVFPVNRSINSIPLIGGSIGLIFGLFMMLEAGLVSLLVGNISTASGNGCEIRGYEKMMDVLESQSMLAWCFYAMLAAIIQLYF